MATQNGSAPPQRAPQAPRPQQPVLEETTYPIFNWSVAEGDQGTKAAIFDLPNGKRMIFPLGSDAALHFGRAMIAPSVHVPG